MMESKDIKFLREAYTNLREDDFRDMMPDSKELYQGEDEARQLQKLSNDDRLQDMSDAEIVDAAHQSGVEDMITFDAEGGLANRDEVIKAIDTSDGEEDGALDADVAAMDIMSRGTQPGEKQPGSPGGDAQFGRDLGV